MTNKKTLGAKKVNWLEVSTHLKNISQIGHLPQIEAKIKKYLKRPPSEVFFKPKKKPTNLQKPGRQFPCPNLDVLWRKLMGYFTYSINGVYFGVITHLVGGWTNPSEKYDRQLGCIFP